MTGRARVAVLGATGQIGTILRRASCPDGVAPLWHGRGAAALPDPSLHWDMLAEPIPGDLRADVILCLAGGRAEPLAQNTDLALAGLKAGHAWGARHVLIASSSAVYGHGPFAEVAALAPVSDYGRAKAGMEQAVLQETLGRGVTLLRIGNIAGADALLGPGPRAVQLDRPAGGPLRRSYIGPARLAGMLFTLCRMAAQGVPLPAVLNLSLSPTVAMAELVTEIGWPLTEVPAPADLPVEVALDTDRLAALGLEPGRGATAADIVDDLCAHDPRFARAR
ncbi:MAG: NAD dependent epimerase/dehydratase family [Rhodobacteraceae bacterium HLUCCA08]|nr:MAG: NAD dependent epimerase/dehydratase family [Rhodobacteraceae bacterium HLUCCA08]